MIINTSNITTDPDVCGGRPCVAGTKFTVAQLLAELADELVLSNVCEDFDLPQGAVTGALRNLATMVDEDG